MALFERSPGMAPRAVVWVAVTAVLLLGGAVLHRRHREDTRALVDVVTRGSMSKRTPLHVSEQPAAVEALALPSGRAAAQPQPSAPPEAAERFARFHAASDLVGRQIHYGKHEVFTMTHCGEGRGVGMRPANQKAPLYAGNTCEPWMARFAIVMLDQLLHTGMKALEWGTGSSTQWTLMRVGHLTSIEHDGQWAPAVRDAVGRTYDAEFLARRWDSHVVRRGTPVQDGAAEYQDPDSFKDYASAEFIPARDEGKFDYVAVDGRSRMLCLKRALKLIKPEGGILLLDNSDRSWYTEHADIVPSHWLRFDDLMASQERTTIWMSCREGFCGN